MRALPLAEFATEEEGVVVALSHRTASFESIGRIELKGFPVPVAPWRARPSTAL